MREEALKMLAKLHLKLDIIGLSLFSAAKI
jgi:hypothetical protein